MIPHRMRLANSAHESVVIPFEESVGWTPRPSDGSNGFMVGRGVQPTNGITTHESAHSHSRHFKSPSGSDKQSSEWQSRRKFSSQEITLRLGSIHHSTARSDFDAPPLWPTENRTLFAYRLVIQRNSSGKARRDRLSVELRRLAANWIPPMRTHRLFVSTCRILRDFPWPQLHE
jgi:hypothetical protein